MYNHYVVNLASSVDRRNHIINIFKELSMTPRFYKAIDGNFIKDDDTRVDDGGLLRLGEKGCALTHLEILEEFLSSDEEYIIVFEDDIEVDARFNEYLPILIEFVKSHDGPCALALYDGKNPHKDFKRIDEDISIRRTLGFSGTYAYVVNREGAKNILFAQCPLHFEIDSWYTYMKLGLLSLYDLNKHLVTPEAQNFESTVDARGARKEQVAEKLGRIKDDNIRKLIESFTLKQKLIFYKQRLNKWLWEMMWKR